MPPIKHIILDEKQRQAIFLDPQKSMIVEAPPGHGKTFVMARRIEYLIESGWVRPPYKILGLTFSNAAAGEMKEDIKSRIQGEKLDLIRVMTFHSFGYLVLRAYGHLIGIDPNFQIVGEIEREKIWQSLIAQNNTQITVEQIKEWITEVILKDNSGWKPPFDRQVRSFAAIYRKELEPTRLDYDGLLLRLLELFKKFPQVLENYRAVFQYILVDEFQDTNAIQFKVLKMIAGGNAGNSTEIPVFILADKEQAIYRFQGASSENIDMAKREFQCAEISLTHNYRCNAEEISKLTQKIRGINVQPGTRRVSYTISDTPDDEALSILNNIQKYQGQLDNISVLSQSEFRLHKIQQLLDVQNIPHVFVPDFRPKSIQKKYEQVFNAISELPSDKKFIGKLATRIGQIYSISKLDYESDEVLKALLSLAVNFDAQGDGKSFSERALQFYNDVFIQINWGNLLRKTVKNKVFVATIHSVKGLQFSQVHISGLSNFEHIHWSLCSECNFGKNKNKLEKHLTDPKSTLYVGVSRAQDALFLYSTKKDYKGKNRKIMCLLSEYSDFLVFNESPQFCPS